MLTSKRIFGLFGPVSNLLVEVVGGFVESLKTREAYQYVEVKDRDFKALIVEVIYGIPRRGCTLAIYQLGSPNRNESEQMPVQFIGISLCGEERNTTEKLDSFVYTLCCRVIG